jgi:hypothetical protein
MTTITLGRLLTLLSPLGRQRALDLLSTALVLFMGVFPSIWTAAGLLKRGDVGCQILPPAAGRVGKRTGMDVGHAAILSGARLTCDLDRLPCQRHDVCLPHLHARSRDAPRAGIQIDLCSLRLPQFVWANEQYGRQLQCGLDNGRALVSVKGSQQAAELHQVHHRRVVILRRWDQGAV